MVSSLRQFLPDLLQNYGSSQVTLDLKLALALQTDASRLRALNGASQLYPLLARQFGGAKVLRPDPTFGEYSRMFPDADTYPDHPGVDVDDLARRAPDHDLVVVVNPNNPTGTTLESAWLLDMAAAAPSTTFLVDESFIEFSDEPSLIRLLSSSPRDNVIVLKSLSKTYGVPGVRLGAVFSTCIPTIARLGEDLPIWNLNSIAEFFLDLVLKTRFELEESYQRTRQDRARFADGLARLPAVQQVHPSGGNFLLVRCADWVPDGRHIVERLLVEDRIYVKDVTGRVLAPGTHLRVAVRGPDENNRFLEAMGRVVEGCGP
jgi:histidinol-phosphate/aromatic aminotransferase/cobyric acid decarboxylase-like protein